MDGCIALRAWLQMIDTFDQHAKLLDKILQLLYERKRTHFPVAFSRPSRLAGLSRILIPRRLAVLMTHLGDLSSLAAIWSALSFVPASVISSRSLFIDMGPSPLRLQPRPRQVGQSASFSVDLLKSRINGLACSVQRNSYLDGFLAGLEKVVKPLFFFGGPRSGRRSRSAHFFALKPISTRRRIASEMFGR
jgi:hypothetical protein